MKYLYLTTLGVLLSALIGLLLSLFLTLEHHVSNVLWHSDFTIGVQAAIVTLGCFILYQLLKKTPHLPYIAHDTANALKTGQPLPFNDITRTLLITFTILILGAGVGPEATLLSVVILLSVWLFGKLRYLMHHYDDFAQRTVAQKFAMIFNFNDYHMRYDAEQTAQIPHGHLIRKGLTGLFIVVGLVTFKIFQQFFHQSPAFSKLGTTNWQWHDFKIFLPLLLSAVGFIALWHGVNRLLKRLPLEALSLGVRVALGGLGIFLIALVQPITLFSGQTQMSNLTQHYGTVSAGILILLALSKLGFLQWCLRLGFIGGDIFPITFAAITQAYAMVLLFPQYDALFIVAIVATLISGILMKNFILAGLMLVLFLPLSLAPIVVGLCILGHFTLKKLAPQPPH